jgi:hypothetical protein
MSIQGLFSVGEGAVEDNAVRWRNVPRHQLGFAGLGGRVQSINS